MANSYKRWLPPALIEQLKPLLRRGIYFSGNYADWAAASREAGTYDAEIILQKVKQATLQVKAGNARFERDSVVFDRAELPYPLLAGLMRAAAEAGGNLSVLDFGGSLGSSYFQCRDFLSVLDALRWNVVEQPHFVRCGHDHIQSDELRFYFDIDEAVRQSSPDAALLASVLQYLPEPYAVLGSLAQTGVRYLVIDRTPFSDSLHDVITVQHVPPEIYPASYPCRIFSKRAVVEFLSGQFEMLADFENSDGGAVGGGIRFNFGGMIFRRK